jgi:hypothetical protein
MTSAASMAVSIFAMPLVRAFFQVTAVEITQQLHLVLGVPAMPLPPLPAFSISGPSAVKRA